MRDIEACAKGTEGRIRKKDIRIEQGQSSVMPCFAAK